ncbi:SDR family oxidoreductase [Labedella endophytica]|jgi:NADP-dependent 3-hydroxy acid dehydrogenase YdfG|uniref:SDR family oxidoreductase n=1 Tax=Labedella endophytica TaxID=1523160 RepID=A0A3S0VGJ3_9MICO|nr:SDR family oxidoreductase [Labedella endophytica]RUR01273.1 SDR family oxidoreductase [Labedella endophytica]
MTVRRAVVTGASSGIGRATAALFREHGWEVLGVARRADRLAELAAETGAETVVADVTVAEDVERVREAVEALGGADVLVCNAGGAIGLDSVETSSPDDWRQMFEVNVIGTQRMIAALLPALRASTTDGGTASIVGVTSIAGHRAYEGGGGYNATKFAQRAVLEVLRLELSGEPIRVIEVAPGMVHTEEFSLNRFGGDKERADAVYDNVAAPLVAGDIAEVIVHAAELPPHVDLDSITVKPVAQAAPHKVARGELKAKA